MVSIRKGTAALLIAGFALSAAPAFADQHDRHGHDRSRNNHYDNRGRGSWDHRSYRWYRAPNYRVYVPHRAYPYGWRPYGYRPGWSLNFYFGRPHVGYGVGGYYPPANYGYYAISPGVPYGSVRIVDAPRDAQGTRRRLLRRRRRRLRWRLPAPESRAGWAPHRHPIGRLCADRFRCARSSQARRSRIARTPTEDTRARSLAGAPFVRTLPRPRHRRRTSRRARAILEGTSNPCSSAATECLAEPLCAAPSLVVNVRLAAVAD